MALFILRRLLWLVPVLITVSIATFFLMYQAPGGPWDRQKPMPEATRRSLDIKFKLDKPLWFNTAAFDAKRSAGESSPLALTRALLDSRFFTYMGGVARLDFGPSYQARGTKSVRSVIVERFPTSAKIGLVALVFAVIVGLPLGMISALRRNSWLDYLSVTIATVGVAVPSFITGVLLLIALSSFFGISPIRRPEEWDYFGPAYLLPGVVLGLGTMAYVARLTRGSLIDIQHRDFVRTARAKGLSEVRVLRSHMLRNALLPVVTVLGPAAAELVTGSIIIETIFGAPGLGREFVDSISARDYPMIMGTTIFYALIIAFANALVDVSYHVLDPRIRVAG